MTNNRLFRKSLVAGIIVLFICISFVPIISGDGGINSAINAVDNIQNTISRITLDGSLSGYVNDTMMNPIEGALVRVYFHETYEEDYSDSSGYYHVTNIPICYCLKNATASKTGYKTEWVLLGITEDTTYDFVLTPLDSPCYPVFNGTMGWNGWFVSCVTVTFIYDPKEISAVYYQIDSESWQPYSIPFDIHKDGVHELCWYYIDNEGNESAVEHIDLKIDKTPPDVEEVEWETFQEPPIFGFWYCKFTCNATDETSGMDRVEMYINYGLHEIIKGAGPIYEFVLQWGTQPWGNPILNFIHYDVAGNSAIDSVNASDIKSYPCSQSSCTQQSRNMWLNWWSEKLPRMFPMLRRLIGFL